MATRQEVFSVVSDERVFQDRKWGTVEEHPHEVGSWLTIMRQLLNDAERAYMSQRGDIGALDEVRKVVAVGVACMEQHGPVGRKAIDFAAQSKNFTVHKAEAPNVKVSGAAGVRSTMGSSSGHARRLTRQGWRPQIVPGGAGGFHGNHARTAAQPPLTTPPSIRSRCELVPASSGASSCRQPQRPLASRGRLPGGARGRQAARLDFMRGAR